MFEMGSCCFVFSLRQGTIFILIFTLICTSLVLLTETVEFFGGVYYVNATNLQDVRIEKIALNKTDNSIFVYGYTFSVISEIISIALSILGLVGIQKNEPKYLQGMYFFMYLEVCVAIFGIFVWLIDYIIISNHVMLYPLMQFIMIFVTISLTIYFAEVIRAYAKKLKRQHKTADDVRKLDVPDYSYNSFSQPNPVINYSTPVKFFP